MIGTVIINHQKQDREKITSLLSTDVDIKVLADGKDGYDALKLVACFKPDIVILGSRLDLLEEEEIPPLLRARSPSTLVVVLVGKISDYQLYKTASNEVSGIVFKETDFDKLPEILKCISSGNGFISPALTPRVLHLISSLNYKAADTHSVAQNKPPAKTLESAEFQFLLAEDPKDYLSKTELKILAQIGEGYASEEIARNLGLAVGTVRNCVSSVMRKIGLNNRTQMARYAYCRGLVHVHPHYGISEKKLV